MPIPLITPSIAAASTPLRLGWSLLNLTGVRTETSSSGGANYFFDFEAEMGPNSSEDNRGRRVSCMISGKALEAGIEAACQLYSQLMSALTGLSTAELVGESVDESKLVGRKVWADVQERTVEGKVYKDFKCFSPSSEVPF